MFYITNNSVQFGINVPILGKSRLLNESQLFVNQLIVILAYYSSLLYQQPLYLLVLDP